MEFIESIQTCVVKKYCNFEGRASRSEFWWFQLGAFIVSFVWSFIMGFGSGFFAAAGSDGMVHVFQVLNYVPMLALFLPTLGVSVRRLHDVGKSGYWWFLNFICCIGGLYLLYLYVQESDGDNEFGPKPQN
ncbi:MAG: DUF805 domain-containing protein [Prevotella sp.]|nr:DUF805 domain-containing protein [Prevotella sp.]